MEDSAVNLVLFGSTVVDTFKLCSFCYNDHPRMKEFFPGRLKEYFPDGLCAG